jgi:hypothetical protein
MYWRTAIDLRCVIILLIDEQRAEVDALLR